MCPSTKFHEGDFFSTVKEKQITLDEVLESTDYIQSLRDPLHGGALTKRAMIFII